MEYNTSYFINVLKGIRKFSFKSRSLENSEMDWNYTGIGDTEVVTEIFSDGFKIYYYDEISIENYYDEDKNFIVKDRKMWNMTGNKLDFYHFRNNRYERILKFVFIGDVFVLRENYVCDCDIYSGDINFFDYGFSFSIRIKGKRKDELLKYTYYLDSCQH